MRFGLELVRLFCGSVLILIKIHMSSEDALQIVHIKIETTRVRDIKLHKLNPLGV